jgi:hypothetical protein
VAFADVIYEFIVGSDRAVVGNTAAAQADPDWCGMVDPESPVQGLLDTATVRMSKADLVEADGASYGPSFLGGRQGTVQGALLPSSLDLVALANAEAKLKRATRALRADGIFRYTPPNDSSPRQLRFRRQDGPRVTGRRPKNFQITLESPDPYALSSSEQSVVITPGAAAGELGVPDPETDPETSALNVAGQQSVFNAGDAPTWPRFRITGPITNPVLLNNSSGQQIVLSYTLAAAEYLDVFPQRGRILFGGTADRYSAYQFTTSAWWQLGAGTNDVRLLASAYSAGAQAQVFWRNAWE